MDMSDSRFPDPKKGLLSGAFVPSARKVQV